MGNFDFTNNIVILYITVINSFLIIILLIVNILNSRKIKKLNYKYNRFMVNSNGEDIEKQIENCLNISEEIMDKNRQIASHLNEIDRNLLYCVQKVGLVRFSAFDDVGSNLSYSIALLDGNNNGVVITSLFARDTSTSYGKPVIDGKSRYPLSAEELQAIDIAVKRHREAYYI